jgi:hypothetical protein
MNRKRYNVPYSWDEIKFLIKLEKAEKEYLKAK